MWELLKSSAQASDDILPGALFVLPRRHWLVVLRKALKSSQRRMLPVTGGNEDREDSDLPGLVLLHGLLDLDPVGGQEFGTHQKKDE